MRQKLLASVLAIMLLISARTLRAEVYSEDVVQEGQLQYYSEYEKDLLYRIVAAEVGDCSDLSQQVVTQVILNRVDSPHFPDTIEGVLYQPYQFSPIYIIYNYTYDERIVENVNTVLDWYTPIARNVLFFKASWCMVYFPYIYEFSLDGVDYFSY